MSILHYYFKDRALERQLEQSRSKLYCIAFSWSHDSMLADDLVQDTLVKALIKLKQLRNPEVLESWLISILNNVWIDYLRQKKELTDIDEYIHSIPDKNNPSDLYDNEQTNYQVREAIGYLPMGQRQVISLVDIAGYGYDEVSKVLGIPIGTVMSRLNRARKSILNKLNNTNNVVFLHKKLKTGEK